MLAVDSSLFGIQGTAELLKEVICAYQKEEAALDGKNS